MSLHGVLVTIVPDKDSQFVMHFWRSMHKTLGTKFTFSTAFHHQIDWQLRRMIQILEDMLLACMPNFGGSWDWHLPLIEFAYNNSY